MNETQHDDEDAGERMMFVTLGMFIIDEIHYTAESGKPPVYDVVGGAGTYAVLGCRLFAPAPRTSRRVGWVVDAGSDFPASVEAQLAGWRTGMVLRRDGDRLTTRGWNGYGAREERAFRYTTRKRRVEVADLPPRLLRARAYHAICAPARCVDICVRAHAALKELGESARPVIVWEPVPGVTAPGEFAGCVAALEYTHIFSPNAKEAAEFLGRAEPVRDAEVAEVALQFLVHMRGPAKNDTGVDDRVARAVVIRCGARGCAVFALEGFPTSAHKVEAVGGEQVEYYVGWFPAYHSPKFSDYKVEDPTGGGNTFLGGFAAGFVGADSESGGTYRELARAAVYGNVAAGYAVEQVGVPVLGRDDEATEVWNGTRVAGRVAEYGARYTL